MPSTGRGGSIQPHRVHAVYDGTAFSIDSWPAAANALVVVNLTGELLGAVLW